MRRLSIIGIGAGNPDHLTIQAIKAMNAVDVFFFLDKGETKDDLLRFRRDICERYIEKQSYRIVEIPDPVRDPAESSYKSRVINWHEERAALYKDAIVANLKEDERGAFLVWGDPMLYDSTIRIFERMAARGNMAFTYDVVPGITSVQALMASHKMPLNGIGESILITTGRRLAIDQLAQAENVVVMLDGQCSFKDLADKNVEIHWGAYVGTDKEILIAGKLSDVAEKIEAIRAEARTQHGWIMDVYLLRKPTS
jgi:precorrin-6A synthase